MNAAAIGLSAFTAKGMHLQRKAFFVDRRFWRSGRQDDEFWIINLVVCHGSSAWLLRQRCLDCAPVQLLT
jgi:hypothetical protein